ncbi:PREDICTED: uncharacterized protein LOC109585577 [Amphimedon queenslandica]|uniref:COR domain-containing protein n=1 Tax=Amphimedon queenslandica TaxID=400682 RepID=A0AAN0JJQ7_AMPQE|nr:PREDICTED: uncharacterized protein LOC109585577 [Amphimedon queenslandica]|eukprot:XP_019857260.1 PREDICTED: uncharacterized protein LOC109585577 [Amphimedon queenslandica]
MFLLLFDASKDFRERWQSRQNTSDGKVLFGEVVPTPVNWVLFRKFFQELELNIISVSDAIAIGVACHIPAADVPEVLKFYHELGAVLYYPQIKGLKNKVILSPKWFVGVIGKAFPLDKGWSETYTCRWCLLQTKGILVQPLYKEIWQSSGIDPEEIIELLVHFRLAAQVQTEHYDSTFKQYFLPAVLPGYTGDPNEVRPGYKLRASPVHITFSTGYVPPGFFTRLATAVATDTNVKLNFDNVYVAPAVGFFDRLAITMNLRSKVERRSIYRNRVCFSYGHPSDDFVLTDINEAIQVDVLRYVPESRHPLSLKTVCQQILKLLDDCCQQVEETLILYHHHNDRSSRKIQYVCRCRHSKEVHYIKDIDAEKQMCSDPVYCKKERRPRSLTNNESLWFKEKTKHMPQEKQLQLETSPRLVDLKEDNDDDDDDTTLLIQKVKSTTNYSPTQINIILQKLTLLTSNLERGIKGDGGVKYNNNKDKGTTTNTLNGSQEHGSTSIEKGQSDIDVLKINDEVQETLTDKLLGKTIREYIVLLLLSCRYYRSCYSPSRINIKSTV